MRRLSIALLLTLLLLLHLLVVDLCRAGTVSITTSHGLDCGNRVMQNFNVSTGVCYHDRISGMYHAFECDPPDAKNVCFVGTGALDGWCRTTSSRNAMRCGSCTATDTYECTDEAVVWHTGCANDLFGCQAKHNCTQHILPLQKCVKNPVSSYWYKLGALKPCNVMLTIRTWVPAPGAMGSGCRSGEKGVVLEQGVPSGFCSAGTTNSFDGVSRRMACNDFPTAQRKELSHNTHEPLPFHFQHVL